MPKRAVRRTLVLSGDIVVMLGLGWLWMDGGKALLACLAAVGEAVPPVMLGDPAPP